VSAPFSGHSVYILDNLLITLVYRKIIKYLIRIKFKYQCTHKSETSIGSIAQLFLYLLILFLKYVN
jgi:hypothetical protein